MHGFLIGQISLSTFDISPMISVLLSKSRSPLWHKCVCGAKRGTLKKLHPEIIHVM